jgi:hypothetical protein
MLVNNLAILDEHKGRDVTNTVECNNIVAIVNIALADIYAICILLCKFLYDWSNSATWTTPLSPKINN